MTFRILAALAIVIFVQFPRAFATSEAYQVDAGSSRVAIKVGKAGAFSFIAGHTHEVSGPIESGTVTVDTENPSQSQIRIVIAASALKVSGADEPPDDRPKVQQTMESDKVLDVARFPHITFASTSVTVRHSDGGTLDTMVAGRLTIRDATQSITAPVRVNLTDRRVVATGHFAVKQTAFGIKPVSVGGVVAVKDALEIEFSISATR